MHVMKTTGQALALTALLVMGSAMAAPKPIDQTLLRKTAYIPDIATFLQIGGNSFEGQSWDGTRVFFSSSASGASQVYRITDQGWPYQLTTFEDGLDFFSLSWGADMAIVGASVGGSEQSQLMLMDTETGQLAQLTNNPKVRHGSVVWAKDDLAIFYSSNEENLRDFHIYRMELASGSARKIFGDTNGVHGLLGIADISQDGTQLIISRFNSNFDNDLFLLDWGTGRMQQLTRDTANVLYQSTTLMPDNKTIWLTCNDNGDGIARLAKMRIGSPTVEWVNDGWLDPRWEVDGLGFSRDYKYMTAVTNEDGYARLHLREAESRRELPSPPLEGQLGGGSFSSDGTCIVTFNNPKWAPDLWRWDPDSRSLTQVTFANYAGINRELFVEPQLIKYKSFDGLEIPAFLYLPKGYQPGTPLPFIIEAHGGPESQSTPSFVRNYQYMLLNGFGMLLPNVRGSSGYGRTYMALDDYKNRKHSLMDFKAAADYLVENKYTKPGMLGIRGGSYGGYVALGMITEYPDLFAAAMDEVGIANFQTFLQNTAAYRRAIREAEYGPLSDSAFLHEISPLWKANLIKTPLLVIHGANDPRVPVGEARQIIAAIQTNGGVVDSLIFADEGHGSGKRSNTILGYRKQVEFFKRYLLGTEMVPPKEKP